MLKATTGGYDGKGNYTVKSAADVEGGFAALGGGKIQLMAERYVDFDREISVLACRSIAGEIAIYPIGQNRHHEEILRETAVPADISESAKNAAITLAHQVMEIFQGVGIFCVEMFLHRDNTVSVNEIAPRPHNSGHYTIEGCFTSQFEQHIRAIAGLPLGDCGLIMPAVMQNVLGEDGHAGPTLVAGASDVLEIPGAYLHMYGKIETRPKRKMGHITALGATIEEATERAAKAKAALKVISK
ncbi:MAG: ATP-grasp domain-containing protein, partial [Defluviitaleaceae bacterium]|nr:ATP-grasp domain-containing protein [Defluviitaleaceae bacterium]